MEGSDGDWKPNTMVVSLHMGWRHLCFANWPVDPAVVRPHLPDALDVDTRDGRAWLSVTPFTNVDVRPPWAPEGVGFALPELNLRTYVTPRDGGEPPGVYFFSLDAQGILGVAGARLFHHLPYYYARIGLDVSDTTAESPSVRFRSRRRHPGARPATFRGTYRPAGERFVAESGTLAHFLTERYRYYTESPRGHLHYAAIEHEPWPLYPAAVDVAENTLFRANRFDHPDGEAVHYYSPGVDTVASRSRRVERSRTADRPG